MHQQGPKHRNAAKPDLAGRNLLRSRAGPLLTFKAVIRFNAGPLPVLSGPGSTVGVHRYAFGGMAVGYGGDHIDYVLTTLDHLLKHRPQV
jgi:hypothetical protein